MNTTSGDGWAIHVVLSKGPAVFAAYCRRNKQWLSAQIAAAKEKGLTP